MGHCTPSLLDLCRTGITLTTDACIPPAVPMTLYRALHLTPCYISHASVLNHIPSTQFLHCHLGTITSGSLPLHLAFFFLFLFLALPIFTSPCHHGSQKPLVTPYIQTLYWWPPITNLLFPPLYCQPQIALPLPLIPSTSQHECSEWTRPDHFHYGYLQRLSPRLHCQLFLLFYSFIIIIIIIIFALVPSYDYCH